MGTWRRAKGELPCGYDPGCRIQHDAPYFVYTASETEKLRCERHAPEPVNAAQVEACDLRGTTPRRDPLATQPTVSRSGERALAFDGKAAAAGDD